MILSFVFFFNVFAKEGTLTPYKNTNLYLTTMPDNTLRFIKHSEMKGGKNVDTVTIDTAKFRMKVNSKPICKVDERSPVVSTCTDKVNFIDWKAVGVDGNWKFETDNNLCLSVGGIDSKTGGYFVHALKCDMSNEYQKFKFKSSRKNRPIFDSQIDEYGEGNILDFHKMVMDERKDRKVLITVKDDKGDKHYRTNTKELNNLFASGNHEKLMDHDFLVDRGITTKPSRGSII